MALESGSKMPSVKVQLVHNGDTQEIDTAEWFQGKKVAFFSVPGAFTPTCSAQHLPGFIEMASKLKEKGVDEIVCMSVNDPFVMKAWSEASGADGKVTMLADGSGHLARALDAELDLMDAGLGKRSHRFSAFVDNGDFKVVNFEPKPKEFGATSAQTLIEQI